MRTKKFCLRGKVQAVGCRMSIQSKARDLAVFGFVRNNRDRSVSGVICSPDLATEEEMILFLKRGPGLSQIERLDLLDSIEESTYTDFVILNDGDSGDF